MRMLSRVLLVLALALTLPVAGRAANPFEPALTVNTGVITRYDIEQRIKLLDALGADGDLRKLAVQQLTEDRVKLQAAKDLGIELPEGAIDAGVEEFATSRGLTMDDVYQVLEVRGIDLQTMDDFVESGLVWREVVANRFRARAAPSEADLDAALELARVTPREVLTLAEIALPFAERGEAETLDFADRLYREIAGGGMSFAEAARQFSRSQSAERGGRMEPMPAAQLPSALRTQVLLLRPGQITRPVPISGGVALIQLVSVTQVRPDPNAPPATPEEREALRQQLFTERITSFGQGYLQELLGDALIVER
jgi:peptidyl-prolyl cis-trans isomerase SurA